jgi:hypothetical protein
MSIEQGFKTHTLFFLSFLFRPLAEGIKDRDRSVIINVLKSISFVRDNAYVLHRHIWNDVHEDWPFYTEQDRATLKR